MPTQNQETTRSLSSEPYVTSNFTTVTGAAPILAAGQTVSEPCPEGPTSGFENEETVWEGRCSIRNFLGRALLGGVAFLASVAVALATWFFGYPDLAWLAYASGVTVVVYWLMLAIKFVRIRRNHYYRLTTRRLFLTTGIFHRRVDQVELIRIKDLFVRQSLVNSWLDVGTLILISSEQTFPKAHLLGVENPQRVRDLIWHHSRLERDQRTSEVNPV